MTDLRSIAVNTIKGEPASLAEYAGKVLLVVNVASKCGLTPQYEGLEALYTRYRDQGLEVLGFPANDFRGQEPGTNEEIESFCKLTYDVDFPLFAKIQVSGEGKHPLYAALIEAMPEAQGETGAMRERFKSLGMTPSEPPELLWNFEKFLVGRDGTVVARFAPATAPDDPAMVGAIEKALAA